MEQNTISGTGSALMGAGLALLSNQLYIGCGLITFGVVLQILVAVLQKDGLNVEANPTVQG